MTVFFCSPHSQVAGVQEQSSIQTRQEGQNKGLLLLLLSIQCVVASLQATTLSYSSIYICVRSTLGPERSCPARLPAPPPFCK